MLRSQLSFKEPTPDLLNSANQLKIMASEQAVSRKLNFDIISRKTSITEHIVRTMYPIKVFHFQIDCNHLLYKKTIAYAFLYQRGNLTNDKNKNPFARQVYG